MKTAMINLILALLLSATALPAENPSGKVVDKNSQLPIALANILVDGKRVAVTDSLGNFTLNLAPGMHQLTVKHIAYQTAELTMSSPLKAPLIISLESNANMLQAVTVNTGYQRLPKERATGSFTLVDQTLLSQSVSPNVIDRLQYNVPGLAFNKVGVAGNRLNLSIRGQSTIFANTDPLLILDNFPFDGNINSINPDDIEDITFLKDAAAASIWGARAANGVIVISSKKGKLNQQAKVSFTSSVNMIEKPDPFYKNRLSTSDYIDIQTKLYNQGYYNVFEQNDLKNISHNALPPLAEIYMAKRDGRLSAEAAAEQVNALRQLDVRNDLAKYLLGQGTNTQYALNLNGGSAKQKYYLSAGYNSNNAQQLGNQWNRLSLQANQTWLLLKEKLDLGTNLFYTRLNAVNNALDYSYKDPYVMLADANGKPLAVPTQRTGYLQSTAQKGLLDWTYVPLLDRQLLDRSSKTEDLRLNLNLGYKVLPALAVNLSYQYGQTTTLGRTYNHPDSYYTRNQINTYTQTKADGSLSLPIPLGGILALTNGSNNNHSLRGQANYQKNWGKHAVNAIAGYELKMLNTLNRGYSLYGYDDEHASSSVVDYVTIFAQYNSPATKTKVPNNDSNDETADRFRSYYSNAAYTYLDRYTLSASARLDQSNLFGVKTNQKGVPLFAIGTSWILSQEPFFKVPQINQLKLRLTFGYNGNIDRSLSAYTTATYYAASAGAENMLTQQPWARIQNPPNPNLRWERVRMLNLGADFALFKNMISGSIDAFSKAGIDLIGNTPFPPSSGISNFKGNYANTLTKGIDLMLNTINLQAKLKWTSTLNFAYVADKVTSYSTKGTNGNYLGVNGYPLEGRPLYAIYSYAWAGLDATNGNPMGYLNGEKSSDYAKIIASYTPETLVYHGNARPTHFGGLRNTFGYGPFSLSFNISYRLNYYIKLGSIAYGTTFGLDNAHGDYALRWQKPGDELHTHVPSVPLATNNNRDNFYGSSSVLVTQGDQLRLEEMNLSYSLGTKALQRLGINQLQFYTNATNLALLYKKTKLAIDPDYHNSSYGPARSLAFGIRLGL